jgi:hypothetical protein
VFAGFSALPIITYFDVTNSAIIPPILFYCVWLIMSIWLGALIAYQVAFGTSESTIFPIFALFAVPPPG